MILKIVVALALVLAVPAAAFGQMTGIRTVGAGGEFATPQDAVAALNAQGVGPGGVTFAILAGTYDVPQPLVITAVGAANRPIEFRGAWNGEVILTRTLASPSGARATWDFARDTAYVTLRSLTLRTVNCPAVATPNISGALNVSNIRIVTCKIETTGAEAIRMTAASFQPQAVSYTTVDGCSITVPGNTGVRTHGPGSLVARNVVRARNGIDLNAPVTGGPYGGSIVEENQVFARQKGISVGTPDTVIRRNRVQLTAAVGGWGIHDYGIATKIHHNTISYDPAQIEETPDPAIGASGGQVGIYLLRPYGNRCVFNSVYLRCVGHPGRAKASAGIVVSNVLMGGVFQSDLVITNNIVHGSAAHDAGVEGSASVDLIFYGLNTNDDITFGSDNAGLRERLGFTSASNCLSSQEEGTGTVFTLTAVRQRIPSTGVLEQASFRTLAEWQTFSGRDAGSVDADPLFVSTTNLHLQAGSPVQGLGTAMAGYVRDIDGDRRKATPDMGADEPRPARLAGDASGDGVVDAADYVVWRNNYGRRWVGLTFGEGDFNLDGRVDAGDYVTWRNLGSSWTIDVNGDGTVDAADNALHYQIWRANYGRTSPPRFTENDGDLNDDGGVDVADYYVWRANYGRRMP